MTFAHLRRSTRLVITLVFSVATIALGTVPVRAQSFAFFDDVENACGGFTKLGGDIGSSSGVRVTDSTIYESGEPGPYSLDLWATHTLLNLARKSGGDPSSFLTDEHKVALVAFAFGEGGGIDNNLGIFNPLNTKISGDDLRAVAVGAGVYDSEAYATNDFPTFDVGVEATARTIMGNNQNRLYFVLSDPTSTAEQFMEALTFFDRYEGNKAWATISIDGFEYTAGKFGNSERYLSGKLSIIRRVRADYQQYGGLRLREPGEARAGSPIPVNGDLSTSYLDCSSQIGSPGATDIVGIARAELAKNPVEYDENVLKYTYGNTRYSEGSFNGNWPWCADFVSWVYLQSGSRIGGGRISGTLALRDWFRQNQLYFEVGEQEPRPGDVAFYFGDVAVVGQRHVNIVVSVQGDTMTTIGGNERNSVRESTRTVAKGAHDLVGFGRFINEPNSPF